MEAGVAERVGPNVSATPAGGLPWAIAATDAVFADVSDESEGVMVFLGAFFSTVAVGVRLV